MKYNNVIAAFLLVLIIPFSIAVSQTSQPDTIEATFITNALKIHG